MVAQGRIVAASLVSASAHYVHHHRNHRVSEASIVVVFDIDNGLLTFQEVRKRQVVCTAKRLVSANVKKRLTYFLDYEPGLISDEVGVSFKY